MQCQAVVLQQGPAKTASTLSRLGQLPVALLVEAAVVVWILCRFAVVNLAYGSVGYVVSLVTVKSRRPKTVDCSDIPLPPAPLTLQKHRHEPKSKLKTSKTSLSLTSLLPSSSGPVLSPSPAPPLPLPLTPSRTAPFLPPQRPEHQGRLTVCIDLDETLICTYRAGQVPRWLQDLDSEDVCRRTVRVRTPTSAAAAAAMGEEDESSSSFSASAASVNANASYVTQELVVFERAGLREFLRRLSMFAEPVLFTAGLSSYAKPVIDELDPTGCLFVSRLYREACVMQAGHSVKDLSGLGRDMRRVVLVDNNPFSFLRQPANGVPCLPFHGSPNDNQLLSVILPLVQSLSLFPDVRPILRARFRMSAWLAGKGMAVPAEVDESEELQMQLQQASCCITSS